MGDQRALHGDGRDDAAEQDERRVELAAADEGLAVAGQAGCDHGHPRDGRDEPEEDPGVAECPVHRDGKRPAGMSPVGAIIASSRSER